MRITTFPAIIVIAALAVSCSASKKSGEGERGQMQKPAQPSPGISPDHCRIVGTVVSIDEALSSASGDPCSKAPCLATVRIDEVLGYGSGFTSRLAKGNQFVMRFQYTLSPTTTLFPEMSPPMPGLTAGAQFQADVRQIAVMAGSSEPEYIVGQYARR